MEESEFLEARLRREREFQAKIDELRRADTDEYTKSKIALEKSIQELEQHQEKMQALYQLNRTKLDYNLQVLQERNTEHTAIQTSYKMRLHRLRETVNGLMSRYQALDAKYKAENTQQTEEYKRLTRHFKDLQEKCAHFEQADEVKFRQVWAMHEAEVRQLIDKVMTADRIIHEQQLCLEWQPPREDMLLQELETYSESGTTTGKSTERQTDESGGAAAAKFSAGKVRKVLDLIKEETSFLLDLRVREQMVDLPADQAELLQMDATLRYLGVEEAEDVDLLVGVFYEGQDEDDETLYVEAEDVLELLRRYFAEKEALRIADVAPDAKKKKKRQVGSESEAERRELRRREERKFWQKLGHVLPDMNWRVWQALEKYLEKYYALLQRRSASIDSAIGLQRQNEELKGLLDQYLNSKVVEELIIA